ncbi:uncharacterized protein HD556DRAFT_1446583 [Suillus plorans]|uniref:Uncharacterized protein n=1 Tax=Suillus plorans TaxID=116603 RepID=A0A9P7AK22_9AGAM|nr:uncharacterized protein HD556DRAFT_1446583 [Suillus plorans]KAG1790014.1 hypothetical protein HD556DRAFT_1446583 [Suillus plorans]
MLTSTSTSPPMVMSTSGILKIRIVFESDARIPHPRLSEDAQDLLFACPQFPGDARDLLFACFTHKGSKPHQDAKDIVFYNDPDDIIPLGTPSSAQPTLSTTPTGSDAFSVLLKAGRKPAPVTAGARRSIRTFKPSARLRDADNACSHPSSSNSSTARKRALSSATERLVSKKVALQLSAPLSDDDDFHAAGADTDTDTDPGTGHTGHSESVEDEDAPEDDDAPTAEDEPDDEPDDEPQDSNIRATLSKSERTADVRTVFTRNDKEWGAYRNGHLSAAVEAEGHAASLDK